MCRWTPKSIGTDHRPGAGRAARVCFLLWLSPVISLGWEGESVGPRICVVAPLGITAGATNTLQIRGLKLADATRVSVTAPTQILSAEIREKMPSKVPNGLEAKEVGDSLVTMAISVPSGLAGSTLMLRVITPEGSTQSLGIRVVDGDLWTKEKEPNNGFREAQPLPLGKGVAGAIDSDKDVDVFTFTGHAQRFFVADLLAARAGSLLDGVLTLYDRNGHLLASNDDREGGRDPHLRFKLPADGTYFLALQDASDHGTPWHSYELSAREEP